MLFRSCATLIIRHNIDSNTILLIRRPRANSARRRVMRRRSIELSGTLILITNPTKEAHPDSMQFSKTAQLSRDAAPFAVMGENDAYDFCKSREFYVAFLTGKLSFDVE